MALSRGFKVDNCGIITKIRATPGDNKDVMSNLKDFLANCVKIMYGCPVVIGFGGKISCEIPKIALIKKVYEARFA